MRLRKIASNEIPLTGRCVQVHDKPFMTYRRFKVYLSKRPFRGFVGMDVVKKVVVASPKFKKLSEVLQKQCLEHEIKEYRYFTKNLPDKVKELQNNAHRHAQQASGQPTSELYQMVSRKKKRRSMVPW